jgi:hypothetical protein
MKATISGQNFLVNGVVSQTLTPECFDGEYKKTGTFYLLTLWLVSGLAMITNFAQAIIAKMGPHRGKTLARILWDLGRDEKHISSSFVDRFSRFNHQSKYGGAGWLSLDVFYNYWEKFEPQLRNNFEGFITRWWIERMENRQAVTNRKKIVVKLLSETFRQFAHEKEIRLLSIASGSAQAVIDAMLLNPDLNIQAILIDVDKTALSEARKNVEAKGLGDRFQIIRGTPKKMHDVVKTFKPHICEMVGFLDYLTQQQGAELIADIRAILPSGGHFLTCNIRNNPEKIFLHWALLWPMIYREDEELADVLVRAGFLPEQIELYYEPFRIHGIARCIK